MICQFQLGMLVMRPCGEPATSGCAMCGRLLCMAHTAMGQNGPACPHCASTHEGYESNEDSEMASTRDEYYEPYGGAAAYGQPGFFSDTDSAHMNRPAAQLQPRKRNEYDPKET